MSLGRLAVWPPLPIRLGPSIEGQALPFPLAREGCTLFSLARHGLWAGLQTFQLGPAAEVLIPAYHHGSEVEAVVRAGLQPRFYELTESLEPDEVTLERALNPRTQALLLIHILGFPQDASRWRLWCNERGLLLIEDAAQAFLATRGTSPVGSWGHMAIFCLYKTFGLPDGAALICERPPISPAGKRRSGLGRFARRYGSWLAQRHPTFAGTIGRAAEVTLQIPKGHQPEQEFDLGDPSSPPAATSTMLLGRVIDPDAAERRRAHYRRLLERLGQLVPPPFRDLPDGASPFAFPIATEERARLLSFLRRRNILGLPFWAHPHPSLPVEEFPRERALRARILGLPVHQELTSEDVERIVDAVAEAPA